MTAVRLSQFILNPSRGRASIVGAEIEEGQVVFSWSYPVSVEVKGTQNSKTTFPEIQESHHILTFSIFTLYKEYAHQLTFVHKRKLPNIHQNFKYELQLTKYLMRLSMMCLSKYLLLSKSLKSKDVDLSLMLTSSLLSMLTTETLLDLILDFFLSVDALKCPPNLLKSIISLFKKISMNHRLLSLLC